VYTKRRNLLYQLVEKLGCSYDKNSVGLFIWAKLPKDSISSEAFIDEILIEKHIFITPGTIFGSNGEGYIRFSLCIEEEKIKEALARF
jgi:aspartate/methionine/tyrosine aminotransferase